MHHSSNSLKYKMCERKDIKALMSDLKTLYQAVTGDQAFEDLMKFKDNWDKSHPSYFKI